jgi:hypothetical protein
MENWTICICSCRQKVNGRKIGMKIIGQPDSYSDMLERIFIFTLGVGVICTIYLGVSSPRLSDFLNYVTKEVEIGPVKGLKILYVAIPFIFALLSRIIKLHDRISDLLKIRLRFDTKHILIQLSRGVGSDVSPERIKNNRNDLMYKVFYRYVGFKDPVIDAQLIRTALDNWGWLWVEVEASFLLILTSIIFLTMQKGIDFLICIGITIVFIFLELYQYRMCIKSAKAEVNSILDDNKRKEAILECFSAFK